jgi:hypothetical protein
VKKAYCWRFLGDHQVIGKVHEFSESVLFNEPPELQAAILKQRKNNDKQQGLPDCHR